MDDQVLDPYKAEKDQQISQFLNEQPAVKEETSQEAASTGQEEAKPAVPEFDAATLKKELGDELTERISSTVVEQLAQKMVTPEDPTKKQAEEVQKLVDEVKSKFEGREVVSWEEAITTIDNIRREREGELASKVKAEVLSELNKEVEEEQQKATAQQQTVDEANNYWLGVWDREHSDLVKSDQIPAVKDPNDTNDPGVKARQEVNTYMALRMRDKNAAGQPIDPVDYSFKLNFLELQAKKAQEDGRNAPVAGVRRGAVQGEGRGPGYKYKDLKAPWERIAAEANRLSA